MSKQTINIGASPNDGTGTPLRTSFDYTNQNFTELYTAVGPSGNNIVVPGTATITGDLTVATNKLFVDAANNRVGIGTASPATDLHIFKSSATDNALIQLQNGTASSYIGTRGTTYGAVDAGDTYIFNSSGNDIVLMADNAAGAIKFAAGGNTESMRLNSTGLGVGGTIATSRLQAAAANAATASWGISSIYSTDSMAVDKGGSLVFGGSFTGSSVTYFAQVAGRKENSTDSDVAGYLAFSTRPTAGLTTERVRVKSTGQVRFVPLAADPSGAEAGDVYYNSSSNKLKCYNGSTWNDLF